MGLDLALGGLILILAIRGWMRGFVLQAIRLGGLVGCVYLADPVRGLARPYVAKHLGSIRPDLMERLLWWASAVAAYVVTVGVATLIVKLQRRRNFGEPEANRSDQFAGFLLGAVKGALVCAFLASGIRDHALGWVKKVSETTGWSDRMAWVDAQARDSKALAWDARFKPATQIWQSAPVRNFVGVVQRHGLASSPGSEVAAPTPPADREETARADAGPHRLELPAPPPADGEAELRAELESLRRQLDDPAFLNRR